MLCATRFRTRTEGRQYDSQINGEGAHQLQRDNAIGVRLQRHEQLLHQTGT